MCVFCHYPQLSDSSQKMTGDGRCRANQEIDEN